MKSNTAKTALLVLFILFVLVFSHLNAQVNNINGDDFSEFTVVTESGLIMRKLPSINSEKVALLPYGTEIQAAIEYGNYTSEKIDKVEGYWRKTTFGKKSGYVFDGFLKRKVHPSLIYGTGLFYGFEKQPTETYGVFGHSNDPGQQQFEIKKMTCSEQEESKYYEFDFEQENYPVFLVEGLKMKEQKIFGYAAANEKLLPGSIQSFYIGDHNYQLVSDGDLVEVFDPENEFSPSFKIENYSLKLIRRTGTERTVQTLFENEEIHIWDGYYEGAFYLDFMGDLDRDDKSDLILSRYFEGGGETFFMLSSEAKDGFEVKLIEKIFSGGC